MRLLLLAVLCAGGSASGLNASAATACQNALVAIECCVLWDTLSRYIQTHSGIDRSACEPLQCTRTGQVQLFVSQSNAVLVESMRFEGSTLLLPVPAAHDMQRLLVWAFISQHFTSTLQNEVQGEYFFEFKWPRAQWPCARSSASSKSPCT